MEKATTRLRELIAAGPTLYVPGCYNAMSGRVLEAAGFPAIYMDYLKTRAPFWKKEDTPQGGRWVDARESDDEAADRWKE